MPIFMYAMCLRDFYFKVKGLGRNFNMRHCILWWLLIVFVWLKLLSQIKTKQCLNLGLS